MCGPCLDFQTWETTLTGLLSFSEESVGYHEPRPSDRARNPLITVKPPLRGFFPVRCGISARFADNYPPPAQNVNSCPCPFGSQLVMKIDPWQPVAPRSRREQVKVAPDGAKRIRGMQANEDLRPVGAHREAQLWELKRISRIIFEEVQGEG